MNAQQTLRRAISCAGIGLHSGRKVTLSLRPAPADTGIRFCRSDLGTLEVPATVEHVGGFHYATGLMLDAVRVDTVEHLLSAFIGLGIDNVVVELNSPEVPIMDGSAAPFVYLINTVGIVEQEAPKEFIRVKREMRVTQGDAEAVLTPYDGFKADYTFVADHPVYNRYPKIAELDFSSVSYVDEVSRARSFGLVKELEQAQSINKCLGSSLENAVGIDEYSVINDDGLRYQDEFVKHKLLDVIGDLYLLGRPILGAFRGFKSGHALNNKLARALLRCEDAWEISTYDVEQQPQPIMQPAALSAS